MRRGKLTAATLLLGLLLSSIFSFAALMALNEAFALQCDWQRLLTVCIGLSLATVLCMWPRRVLPQFLLFAVLYAAILTWQRQTLSESASFVIWQVTDVFAACYDRIMVVGQATGDAFLFLAALAAPLIWVSTLVCCREGSVLLLALICSPILVLCLMIVDIAPVFWLVVLTCVLLILLVSQSVRERSSAEGVRVAWWLILPTLILVSAITALWPPADYVRSDWANRVQLLAEETFLPEDPRKSEETPIEPERPAWRRRVADVDLSRVGPQRLTGTPVLECRSDKAKLYLRGYALGSYKDNNWEAAAEETGTLETGTGTPHQLQVQTIGTEAVLYTTYELLTCPEEGTAVGDAYIQNDQNLRSYMITYCDSGVSSGGPVSDSYRQVPDDLRLFLSAVLEESGLTGVTPQEIAAYVRELGTYDLDVEYVPVGQDFVRYFLEETQRGYCVHFATATTMLLRTAGIPARYVTGYLVSGQPGAWTLVTEDDAHAWVEYYTEDQGWVLLDPTPAAAELDAQPEPDSETEPELPQEPDEPEQTQPDPPEPEADAAPEKQPQQQNRTETVPEKQKDTWPAALLWIALFPVLILAVWLRRSLLLRRRRRRCETGETNRRALALWVWLVRLSKVESRQISEELLCLAEKARFSQHILTEAELALLQQALEAQIQSLEQASWIKRLWYRLGLVLY